VAAFQKKLDSGAPIPTKEAAEMFKGLGEALECMEERGYPYIRKEGLLLWR
jgi:hypothetical protein